jgi:hypothetical protein
MVWYVWVDSEEEPHSENPFYKKYFFHLSCHKPYGKGKIQDENRIDGFAELPDDKKDVMRTWLKNWNAKADEYLNQSNQEVELTDEETKKSVVVDNPPG